MILHVIGSSSAGNCYILENGKEALLIECGVRFDAIQKALLFNLTKVRGCLVSHEHNDHCKSVKDVMKAGINVYATMGTHIAMETADHHRAIKIEAEKEFYVGSFRVIPFDVKHDARQPVGFLINHPETGTILFVTDTYYVKNTFRGLNNVIVEANYCQKILDEKMAAGASPEFLRNRIFKSHMSLNTCKDLLSANDLTNVNNIVLIHLSDSNSHAVRFKEEIAALTGKMVHIAEPGMKLPFSKQPF